MGADAGADADADASMGVDAGADKDADARMGADAGAPVYYTYIHTYIDTIYTHTHTYIHTHIQIHTYIHNTYTYTHIHTYIRNTHTYTHTHIHIYTHTHIHIYTQYMHIYTRTSIGKTKIKGVISTEGSEINNIPKVIMKSPPPTENNRVKPKKVKEKLRKKMNLEDKNTENNRQIENYFQKSSAVSQTENLNSAVLHNKNDQLKEKAVADQWERLGVGGTRLSMCSRQNKHGCILTIKLC